MKKFPIIKAFITFPVYSPMAPSNLDCSESICQGIPRLI